MFSLNNLGIFCVVLINVCVVMYKDFSSNLDYLYKSDFNLNTKSVQYSENPLCRASTNFQNLADCHEL